MKKIFAALVAPLLGVLAAAGIAFAPAASAAAGFTAFDNNGALVTQHSVYASEHLTYKGHSVTAVLVKVRSNGFGGYYYQFHTTPASVLGGTTGIVTLVPVS